MNWGQKAEKKSKQDEPEWLKTNWMERIVGEDLKLELDSFDVLWLLINMYWKTKVQLAERKDCQEFHQQAWEELIKRGNEAKGTRVKET